MGDILGLPSTPPSDTNSKTSPRPSPRPSPRLVANAGFHPLHRLQPRLDRLDPAFNMHPLDFHSQDYKFGINKIFNIASASSFSAFLYNIIIPTTCDDSPSFPSAFLLSSIAPSVSNSGRIPQKFHRTIHHLLASYPRVSIYSTERIVHALNTFAFPLGLEYTQMLGEGRCI
jgi:hypothetical protein